MEYVKVVNGLARYIREEMYPAMTDWQKMIAADVVTRAVQYSDSIKDTVCSNSVVRALGYVDADGGIDIDGILNRVRQAITDKGGKWQIAIPLMPKFTFTEADVDRLASIIKAEAK